MYVMATHGGMQQKHRYLLAFALLLFARSHTCLPASPGVREDPDAAIETFRSITEAYEALTASHGITCDQRLHLVSCRLSTRLAAAGGVLSFGGGFQRLGVLFGGCLAAGSCAQSGMAWPCLASP